MPNIGAVLKAEISRLACRELGGQVKGMKKASTQYRRHIAALKRQVAKLEREVSVLQGIVHQHAAAPADGCAGKKLRFAPNALRSQRARFRLSAAVYGRLVGVSAQSVYGWEHGASRPCGAKLATLATLRSMGKREARARLEQIDTQGVKARGGNVGA
jgi:DNA-binding transcriptional regulator YiaG